MHYFLLNYDQLNCISERQALAYYFSEDYLSKTADLTIPKLPTVRFSLNHIASNSMASNIITYHTIHINLAFLQP